MQHIEEPGSIRTPPAFAALLIGDRQVDEMRRYTKA